MKPIFKKNLPAGSPWILFVILLLKESNPTVSFVPTSHNGLRLLKERTTRSNLKGNSPLYSILDDDNIAGSDKVDFDNFNPLSYKASKNKNTVAYNFSATQISLRKTRMQELNNDLLNAAGDKERTQQILQDNKDFLLEPLEDSEAVLVRIFLK